MRKTALSALGLVAVLSVPAVAVGTPGPFAGVVRAGQTKSHVYDNNPADFNCIHLAVPYTVTLTYAPPTDTLTLSAGGVTATGANGRASVSFWSGTCTSFSITVSGDSVLHTAGYVVSAGSGAALIDQ